MPLPTKALLFGHPIKHSISPHMHSAALSELGIAAQYQAENLPPEQLEGRLQALRASQAWGANLTIPHKEAALPLLDSLSNVARGIGAVNTVINRDGHLHGTNTDAYGFLASLREAGLKLTGHERVVVLGAGGAARAVVYGLRELGCAVQIHNRTLSRAETLAESFVATALNDQQLEEAVLGCDVLVNTSSVGLNDLGMSPLPHGLLPRAGVVADIVYRPLATKLLLDAKAAGLVTVDGLGMLVHQGARSLNMWMTNAGLKRQAKIEVMRQAALAAL